MKNYTTEVIPYIPVTAWEYIEDSYLTGHIHRGSAYECDDDCGTCDGAMCDYCTRVINRDVKFALSSEQFRTLLATAFPSEEWEYCVLPVMPSIRDVHDVFPELYQAIIVYLDCPDIFQDVTRKPKTPEVLSPEVLSPEACTCKVTYVHSSVCSGIKGSLIKGSIYRALIEYNKDEKILSLSSSNLDELRHAIPGSLLKCLDDNMPDKFSNCDGIFKYEIPRAWLEDANISYVYI